MVQPATKKMDLWRLPPVLIVHLKRFYFNGFCCHCFVSELMSPGKKSTQLVNFPLGGLEMAPYCGRKQQESIYDLYAVTVLRLC